ncbi:hypothetical protein MASR2M15_21380 [Anaerolineales bacterium]
MIRNYKILILLIIIMTAPKVLSQERISPTPIRVTLGPTSTPIISEVLQATETPTRTPTPPGPALLEIAGGYESVGVHVEPDPSTDRIGNLKPGEQFPVIGRFFQWYQFEYPSSPTGKAWIYLDYASIIGDAAAVPEINPYADPTEEGGANTGDLTATWEVITLTPGGDLTATAEARVLVVPTRININIDEVEDMATLLPTFTSPANIASSAQLTTPVPTAQQGSGISTTISDAVSGGIPPILPIFILGILGIIGLAFFFLKR